MKKQWKGFVAGILVSVLFVGLIGSAFAAVGQRAVNVSYNDIKVTMNGSPVNLVDADGIAVEPFIIDGTTYLPVRAVATALGLEVGWDGQTKTVTLANKADSSIDGIRPEFKEIMDTYEAFMNEYAAFMTKYAESGYSSSMLTDYINMMERYTEFFEKVDALDEDDMTISEIAYYTEVMLRVAEMLSN